MELLNYWLGLLVVAAVLGGYILWWLRFSRSSIFHIIKVFDSLVIARHQRIISMFNGGPEYQLMNVTLNGLIVVSYNIMGIYAKNPRTGSKMRAVIETEVLEHLAAVNAAMTLHKLDPDFCTYFLETYRPLLLEYQLELLNLVFEARSRKDLLLREVSAVLSFLGKLEDFFIQASRRVE